MTALAATVRRRAGNRCEYCRLPQAAFPRPFHIEHVIARQHGGQTVASNLALACQMCNLKKGPNLSGVDPDTGTVVRLFHPRQDRWDEHFIPVIVMGGPGRVEIRGLTDVGRATVNVMALNAPMRQVLRYELWQEGLYRVESGDQGWP